MASTSKLKDGRWFVQYKNPDPEGPKKKREYFGRGPAAETLARHRKQELETLQGDTAEELAFWEVAQAYLNSRVNMPKKGVHNLYLRFSNVIGPHIGDLPVSLVNHSRLDKYVLDRRVERRVSVNKVTGHTRTYNPPSPVTIHDELTDIMTVLNWAAYVSRPPLIKENPARGYKKGPRISEPILPPTDKEIERILKNAAPHLIRVILMDLYCGYRPGPSELFAATWDLVDFSGETITVVSAKKRGLVKRNIPLHPHLKKLLLGWYNEDRKLTTRHIIHYKGKPIASVKSAWKRAKERAGIIRRLRLYDCRHAFVTRLLEKGADIKAVSEMAGHKNAEITRRIYQHVSDGMKQSAIETLPTFIAPSNIGNPGNPKSKVTNLKKAINSGG